MAKRKPASPKICDCLGARKSRRRDAVLDTVISSGGHLSAEEVHREAKKKVPGIGIATVYRSLKCLCGCGKVAEFIPPDGVARYEAAGGRGHHDHLICTVCGCFVEAMDPEIERLQERLAARHGFRLEGHRLEIYGLCACCVKKK